MAYRQQEQSVIEKLVLGVRDDSSGAVTCLPQDPRANTARREAWLTKKRKEYVWMTRGIPDTPIDLPFLEGFPEHELPSPTWVGKLGASLARVFVGSLRVRMGIGSLLGAFSSASKAKTFVEDLIRGAETNQKPVSIDDYEGLHAFPAKRPASVIDFGEDDAFARQRLQGGNCVVIEKCSADTRAKLKILDSDPSYKALQERVDSLIATGKLFAVDHELLRGMEDSPFGDTPRYLAPSIALFEAVDDDLLPLKPIGIQLDLGDRPTATPIFTPDDGNNWKIAKACFESSDFIIHEVVSHLGNTHVLLEGPMVSMHRQLPKEHPIHALFAPHVEGTALINWGAQEILMAKDSGVDQLHGNKLEDTWKLCREQTLQRMSKDFSPEADFATRHMTKEDFPGRYPYRDFGLKYWKATHNWVKDYLDIYYTTDADINDDSELQAFVTELVDMGELRWLEEWKDSKDKKALLTKVLASLIYSASTLHAAVNFPQGSIMSYPPNTPGSIFRPPPVDKAQRTFADFLAYLPPLEATTTQVILCSVLGSVYYTQLGNYERGQFSDDRVLVPLARFQQTLKDIATELVDENTHVVSSWRQRGKGKKEAANFAYTTLLPENIPQSVNI